MHLKNWCWMKFVLPTGVGCPMSLVHPGLNKTLVWLQYLMLRILETDSKLFETQERRDSFSDFCVEVSTEWPEHLTCPRIVDRSTSCSFATLWAAQKQGWMKWTCKLKPTVLRVYQCAINRILHTVFHLCFKSRPILHNTIKWNNC